MPYSDLNVVFETVGIGAFLKRRIKIRFGIRFLLICTLLASVVVAYFGHHFVRQQIQRPIVERIQLVGGEVIYDCKVDDSSRWSQFQKPSGSKLVRYIFGNDIYATVGSVHFCEPGSSDKDLVDLYKLSGLNNLMLSSAGFSDDCIRHLVKIPKLEYLSLDCEAISPEALARLVVSKSLTGLTLFSVKDEHLRCLKEFDNLESLQICRSVVTDQGVASIGTMKGLKSLSLLKTRQVTDRGIESLASLKKLELLQLCLLPVTDVSMKTICGFNHLQALLLYSCSGFSAEAFREISSLEDLEVLSVNHSGPLHDTTLVTLSRLTKLRKLNFDASESTVDGLNALEGLPLKSLNIWKAPMTEEAVQSFTRMKSLEFLSINVAHDTNTGLVDKLIEEIQPCVVRCCIFDKAWSGGNTYP